SPYIVSSKAQGRCVVQQCLHRCSICRPLPGQDPQVLSVGRSDERMVVIACYPDDPVVAPHHGYPGCPLGCEPNLQSGGIGWSKRWVQSPLSACGFNAAVPRLALVDDLLSVVGLECVVGSHFAATVFLKPVGKPRLLKPGTCIFIQIQVGLCGQVVLRSRAACKQGEAGCCNHSFHELFSVSVIAGRLAFCVPEPLVPSIDAVAFQC